MLERARPSVNTIWYLVSKIRSLGEQIYQYEMKKKLHLLDKDSSSEDDMDIDLLINNAYKTRADKS